MYRLRWHCWAILNGGQFGDLRTIYQGCRALPFALAGLSCMFFAADLLKPILLILILDAQKCWLMKTEALRPHNYFISSVFISCHSSVKALKRFGSYFIRQIMPDYLHSNLQLRNILRLTEQAKTGLFRTIQVAKMSLPQSTEWGWNTATASCLAQT